MQAQQTILLLAHPNVRLRDFYIFITVVWANNATSHEAMSMIAFTTVHWKQGKSSFKQLMIFRHKFGIVVVCGQFYIIVNKELGWSYLGAINVDFNKSSFDFCIILWLRLKNIFMASEMNSIWLICKLGFHLSIITVNTFENNRRVDNDFRDVLWT